MSSFSTRRSLLLGQALVLAVVAVLVVLSAMSVGAQTPEETAIGGETAVEATPEPTPGPDVRTTIRLETDAVQPIGDGAEFPIRILVEEVEHLAGFQVSLRFDPERLAPVLAAASSGEDATPVGSRDVAKAEGLGEFLSADGRQIFCSDAVVGTGKVTVVCNILAPPLCLGGQPGAAGSGVLGTIFLESRGGGMTEISLADSALVADDYDVCEGTVGPAESLPAEGCLTFRESPDASAPVRSCEPPGTSATVVGLPVEVEGRSWVELEGLGWALAAGPDGGEWVAITGDVVDIPHRRQGITVELEESGGGSAVLIGVIIAVVVAVAVAGGAGGYLWYRRRSAGVAP
jgi:hypothetical protein